MKTTKSKNIFEFSRQILEFMFVIQFFSLGVKIQVMKKKNYQKAPKLRF